MSLLKSKPAIAVHAGALCDGTGRFARPATLVLRGHRVVAAGRPTDPHIQRINIAASVELPDMLLLPAMCNAHAHLDMTTMGPQPFNGDFVSWIRHVIAAAPRDDQTVTQAVQQGAQQSLEQGVGYLGDIARTDASVRARLDTQLPGVSFFECLGLGDRQPDAIASMKDRLHQWPFETRIQGQPRGIILGLQPHAPYSAGPDLYHAATKLSQSRTYRLATHLAESQAELEFVRDATGPFADMLRDMGLWHDAIQPTGKHPVDHLKKHLKHGRWLAAHCNYLEDEHVTLLARTGTSVAYCPIASDYFSEPRNGPHRYRDLLDAGVNVCLGTDSILCQPPPPEGAQPMSILAPMRHLFRRDQTDPLTLLRMATTHGLVALGFNESDATFNHNAATTPMAIRFNPDDPTDPLVQVLNNDHPITPVHLPSIT